MPTVSLLGTAVHKVDREQLESYIVHTVRQGARARVLNVNVQCLNLCYEQAALRDILNQAELVFCDGFGVRLGARLKGHRLPPRITYADWIWHLGARCAAEGMSLYFLGARPGVAARAADTLKQRFPALKIAGTHHGYFDHQADSADNRAVIAAINEAEPDILLVGFGMPRQEYWLSANWSALNCHIGLTGGAVFDYVAGELRRAPRWMTDYGLEWLGRLVIEPRRLWRRYVVGNPLFFWRLLTFAARPAAREQGRSQD